MRGWNLLANPYPCDVNWDAAAFWTKPAQMNNAFYTWNAASNGYRVYLGTTGTPGVSLGSTTSSSNVPPNIIPSSQAFFVNVTSPGSFTLSVQEGAKVTSTSGVFTRSAVAEAQQIRIRLKNGISDAQYDAMVRINEIATDGFDAQLDLVNFPGSVANISLKSENSDNLVLNSIAPVTGTKAVSLSTSYMGSFGNYTLSFSEMETLLENNTVYLKDNLLGSMELVTPGFVYNYSVSSNDGLLSDRFELVMTTNSVTSVGNLHSGTSVVIYPNPSDSKNGVLLSLKGFEGTQAEINVFDAVGKKVIQTSVALGNGGSTEIKMNDVLPAGVYTIKTTGGKKTTTQKWIVK
jgi:hypothetical protein